MSIHIMSAAVKNTVSQKMTRFVLVALCDFANREGMSYPSIKGIMEWTGLSRSAIQRALGELRHLGEIVPVENVAGGRGRATTYRIMVGLDDWIKGPPRDTLSERREREKGAMQRLFSTKGPLTKGLSDGPFSERASELGERASDSDPLHIEERARPILPSGTVNPLISERAGTRDSPRAIANDLQEALGVHCRSRNAASWHLAEHDVCRWQSWGATRDLIVAVGRQQKTKGRTDIPPKYLDGPISDAIADAERPRPEPQKATAYEKPLRNSVAASADILRTQLRDRGGDDVRAGDGARVINGEIVAGEDP